MNTATQKISSLLFILLGCAPILFGLFISLKKLEVRQRMKEELKTSQLQTLIVPEEKVRWMDKHEIWINDMMFDIHTRVLENGKYTFTGLYDEEETSLVERERDNTDRESKQSKLLALVFKSLPGYYCALDDVLILLPQDFNFNSFQCPSQVDPFREIITPPPQVTG